MWSRWTASCCMTHLVIMTSKCKFVWAHIDIQAPKFGYAPAHIVHKVPWEEFELDTILVGRYGFV